MHDDSNQDEPGLPRKTLEPGELVLRRFIVRRRLGRGGVGVVFLAEHMLSGQRVALKMLNHDSLNNPSASTRLLLEARAAASLRSEHVVAIHDFDSDPIAGPVLVMEYLEGESLANALRTGALPLERARNLGCDLLDGLASVHDAGVTHRDLKPSNLFIERAPHGGERCKILDFGIARGSSDTHIELTKTGELLGTPSYMAPEQIRGSEHVDARSDLYAAGVCLFAMLTREKPFVGDDAVAVVAAILEGKARTLEAVTQHTWSTALESFFARALQCDPQMRFRSAGEMKREWRDACDALLSGEPEFASWDRTETGDSNHPSATDARGPNVCSSRREQFAAKLRSPWLAPAAATFAFALGLATPRGRIEPTTHPSATMAANTVMPAVAPSERNRPAIEPPAQTGSIAIATSPRPVAPETFRAEEPRRASPPAPAPIRTEVAIREARRVADSGDYDRAREIFRAAIAATPGDLRILGAWGFVEIDAGRPGIALSIFRRAVAIDARYADAWFGIAEANQDRGDMAAAASAFERYLALRPSGDYADLARRELRTLHGAI